MQYASLLLTESHCNVTLSTGLLPPADVLEVGQPFPGGFILWFFMDEGT